MCSKLAKKAQKTKSMIFFGCLFEHIWKHPYVVSNMLLHLNIFLTDLKKYLVTEASDFKVQNFVFRSGRVNHYLSLKRFMMFSSEDNFKLRREHFEIHLVPLHKICAFKTNVRVFRNQSVDLHCKFNVWFLY